MYIVILVLVLLNFFFFFCWLDLLNKIFKPTYDWLHCIVPLTIVTSFSFVLVPIKFPSIVVEWLIGCFLYVVIGVVMACIPVKK